MAEPLILYTVPMSRGRIARWMLEEVGEPYETVVVQFGRPNPRLTAVNPMAKVPAITHGDRIVTEAAAICAYLADAFPDAGLAPPMADRDAYYRWLFFAAGPLEQAITTRAMGWQTDDPQKRGMLGFGDFDRTVDVLEGAVSAAGDGWLAADHFTAADLYVGAHLGWGTGFGLLPKRDAFMAFLERVNARPAARRAAEIDDALTAEAKAGG